MKQAGIRTVLTLMVISFTYGNPFVDRNTISKIVENRSKSVVNVTAKFRSNPNNYKRIPGMFGYFFASAGKTANKSGRG